ncbi:MAG: DEAD/DEAH box helicase [Candidatus Methylacidiphilales bacterium]
MQQLDGLQNLLLPDPWQSEAVRVLKSGCDLVLTAPTGAGKTHVLEQLIESSYYKKQVVYTAPTRALANDKFLEWQVKGWNVGIVTGDLTRNPDAPVLVGTLEAVQGRLRRASRSPALVVIDEFQWLGDSLRGNHYEGFCIHLTPETRLLLMSGSVANPDHTGRWLERLGRPVRVITHRQRPVPLEETDADALARKMPDSIQGFWSRRMAGALWAGLGPVLVFAPHRREAERLARQAARELPPPENPLILSAEQQTVLGKDLSRLIESRIAFHHSGLDYRQRAGVIEPLAKRGQLRIVVSTLGLGSGINFSLRSVLITSREYQTGPLRHVIPAHELLQMAGRAGRRGLDTTGYLLVSRDTPRLMETSPLRLVRATPLPWSAVLSSLNAVPHDQRRQHLLDFSRRLLSDHPIPMGLEATPESFPATSCGRLADTARARLVRRKRRPFKGCKTCSLRPDCLRLDPAATPVWHWIRLGLLSHQLEPTSRGRFASCFLGPEGLAVAAVIEAHRYPVDQAILDLADLFGGERFCEDAPRWSGRLADACRHLYQNHSVEGWLENGVPPQYGFGAARVLSSLINKDQRKTRLVGDHSGVGDIDRLITEWSSLLKQIVAAEAPEHPRWDGLQEQASAWLALFPAPEPPEIPALLPPQTEPVHHRLRWNHVLRS